MTTVDTSTTSSSILATLNSGSSGSSSSTTTEDIQNRFLTLLVAQLENQDPLNPLDNTEITSQLAQMSTVQGIEQLNTQLTSLVDSLAQTQAVQASSLIGNTVLVPGANLTLSDGEAFGGVNLSSAADQVTVSILDSSGKVVQTQTLGANEAGNVLFSWDGSTSSGETAPDGAYTFEVSASNGSSSVTAEALQLGTVSALTRTTSGSFRLDLGSLGMYDFSDVQQIF
ncbi:flagellar hook assembly protein FlgD [Propionivibrio sp.]|jgi:flagellar basal-body rod modification protein FlgD|uniref:flagellar hook assembly protein FlgD n=1 Tax=Propionivibrio sp. TaxID=2212460 RepID=UPI00272E753C|nr:flagellar hook assembly protein FlgD [Propionivibrio sp.]